MNIGNNIYRVRTYYNLTQEQFAESLGVSRQAVQKWESGSAVPDISKLQAIASKYCVSLDMLVNNADQRLTEEFTHGGKITVTYDRVPIWAYTYSQMVQHEYTQSIEEGLDVREYEGLFKETAKLKPSSIKDRMCDLISDIVLNAPQIEGYKYTEPSELEKIKLLRNQELAVTGEIPESIHSKIKGAFIGRVCGCSLGKPVEGRKSEELTALLKSSGNYPMHRYIETGDITDELVEKYGYKKNWYCLIDMMNEAPSDDDTNYIVLASVLIDTYGRSFTPYDVILNWTNMQRIGEYCTAEQLAYRNFVNGYVPPATALYKNPGREWLGAQIRGDYYGYINPGDPEAAADMAWRDASVSHVKNGIYGEMFVSAMIASAAVTDNIEEIILSGLSQIPATSRLYEGVMKIIDGYKNGVDCKKCFTNIHKEFDEYNQHCWTHTVSNAEIIAASLLYGAGDYGKSICLAVQTGFDTDCNGATVGSIIGMRNGIEGIDEKWYKPFNNRLLTCVISKHGSVDFDEFTDKIMEHIALK